MANYIPITWDIIDRLTDDVTEFLYALLRFRCLTDKLASEYFCKDPQTKDSFQSLLEYLENECMLQRISFFHKGKNESVLFLTERGIALIKALHCGTLPAAESRAHKLMLLPPKIPHQLVLNEFALAVEQDAYYCNSNFSYKDRLYLGKISRYIFPDALMMLDGQPIFVEADRGTEGYDALLKKFRGYYHYIFSTNREFYSNTVKVVFVLGDVKTGDRRRQTIMKAFLDSGCYWLQSQFDLLVGTKDELHEALFYRCSRTEEERLDIDKAVDSLMHRFRRCPERCVPLYPDSDPDDYADPDLPGYVKKPLFADAKFTFPIRVGAHQGESRSIYVEYCSKIHPSVLSPIITEHFKVKFSSPLIVVFPSERDARNILKMIREHTSPPMPIFYCTTTARLRSKRSIYEALFTVDAQDRLYHFIDDRLTNLEFERKISKNG